jgi:lytic murein transglycosylase
MQDFGKTLGAVLGLGLSVASAAPVDLGVKPGAAAQAGLGGPVLVQASASGSQAGLQRWIAGFRGRALSAGISASVFDTAMTDTSYDPDIIRRDRTQSEFTKTIWDYLDTAVSDARVTNGRAALAEHRAVLERIEARYGVEKEVVTAIWGLESAYGTFRGKTPTLGALATLAYDGRRGPFFEAQLLAGLKILQSGDTTPARMQGSWAGAMGHTQFMPTSYLDHAVDFSGDGKRDIWSDDPTDALASTAAYLASFGWTKGMPWGVEVTLPEGFNYAETGERVKKPSAGWQAQGVRQVGGANLPDHGPASILLPAGAQGVALLIFANFQVIERYNSADAYVIAVGHLADRIGGAPPFKAGWPREDRALSFDERIEMQKRLTSAGFDTEGIDGKIGPNTIAAVRGFQRAKGLIPDGYASLEILKRLR